MTPHVITQLANRYPQLLLPIGKGVRDTEAYKDAVLRGKPITGEPDFSFSPEDCLSLEQTPAGEAEVLCLAERGDFEHAVRALAYRCEDVEILPSVGAMTIRGLINGEKIRRRQKDYLAQGGENWGSEFRRFTADKRNYQDTLILLSAGEYSAVPASELDLAPEDWKAKSACIRKYHELTHFVCRSLFPEDVDEVRDEILADLIGLKAAFGHYDPAIARRFLGIREGDVHEGGRLRHYVDKNGLDAARERAERMIDEYGKQEELLSSLDVFSVLLVLMGKTRDQRADEDSKGKQDMN